MFLGGTMLKRWRYGLSNVVFFTLVLKRGGLHMIAVGGYALHRLLSLHIFHLLS